MKIKELAERWDVSATTIEDWQESENMQYKLLTAGRKMRTLIEDWFGVPIASLSKYAQERGLFVHDIVEASGLTKQTLNRLAKKRNTHRLRDLVAGTAVLVATRNRSNLQRH